MLPTQCYYEAIKGYFKNPATYVARGPCGDLCSFCNGKSKSFTGAVSKDHLVVALQANIFDRSAVRDENFVTFLTDKDNMHKLKKSI